MNQIPTFGDRVDGVEYISRPGGYAVVLRENGDIAVVRTLKGLFLPGGAVEPGETASGAAVRETHEETGLRVRVTRHLGRADQLVQKASTKQYFRKECDFYLAELISSEGRGIEEDHSLEWLPAADALSALSYESQIWAVDRSLINP